MEEKKERQWPPVRRQKKVPKWQRLLRKYWPPIRLGLLILAAVLVIWLCIAGIGKLFGGIGKEKVPEVTEPTEYVPTEEEIQQMAEELLQEAEFIAAGYDYTKASEMLQDFKYYDQAPALAEAVSRYAELDSKLVSYPNMKEVTHVFFHSLIVDTDRAFDDDFTNGGYNQYMTTIQEFLDMMEEMYARGFVLVSPYDVAYEVTDDLGTHFVYGDIRLPEGKKPFIMSQDDVNYYGYMIGGGDGMNEIPGYADPTGDGFATRIVIGEDGYPTCEYMDAEGKITFGDYDLVPVLERFIQNSPLDELGPVATCEEINAAREACRGVTVSEPIRRYMVALTEATRSAADVSLGVSPRGLLWLMRACQAYAAVKGRDYVLPDDVKTLAVPVFAHRIITRTGYGVSGKAAQVVSDLLKSVPVPTEDPALDKRL